MNAAFYEGWLGHTRLSPKYHSFRYRLCLCYLDLDAIDQTLSKSVFWSRSSLSPACFRPSDFLDRDSRDLKKAVIKKVKALANIEISGRVCMLASLRYFGFIMNPLTVYYCFDAADKLQAILLEVTNTPWNERHHYVVMPDKNADSVCADFEKAFHVSPFNPMNQRYQFKCSLPGERVNIEMKVFKQTEDHSEMEGLTSPDFAANLSLERKEMNARSMTAFLVRYPFMTLKVCLAIYWQAIRLRSRGLKVFSHPKNIIEKTV